MNLEDRAQLQELENIQYALLLRKKEKETLTPNGYCYYCFEEVGKGKLFCNGDCASRYHKLKQINGY